MDRVAMLFSVTVTVSAVLRLIEAPSPYRSGSCVDRRLLLVAMVGRARLHWVLYVCWNNPRGGRWAVEGEKREDDGGCTFFLVRARVFVALVFFIFFDFPLFEKNFEIFVHHSSLSLKAPSPFFPALPHELWVVHVQHHSIRPQADQVRRGHGRRGVRPGEGHHDFVHRGVAQGHGAAGHGHQDRPLLELGRWDHVPL